jgi:hypothetical protein
MMVAYLPKENILAEPDAFSPPTKARVPLVVTAVPFAKALHASIQRLKLDVQVIAPFPGNLKSDTAELASAAGLTGTS